jgi:hypothetical protein
MLQSNLRSAFAISRHAAAIASGATLIAAAISLSLYDAGHSLWAGLALANPLPYFDQWYFVLLDYFRYLDGQYAWINLFSHHNEHRIVTTRLVLFADALFFRMRGVFPIGVTYATLALIGALVARLATGRGRWLDWSASFLIGAGMLWSTCQWETLGLPFLVCFPLLHLFALGTIAALAVAVARGSTPWLAAAMSADFLAVYSFGSGPFLILAAALVPVWLRHAGWRFWLFAGFHVAWATLYAVGGIALSRTLYGFAAPKFAMMLFAFIGLPFGVHGVVAGMAGLALFLVLALWLTRRSLILRTRNEPACVALVSLAAFVVIEASLVAYTRAALGVDGRYATAALVFWAATLAATWRVLGRRFYPPLVAVAMLITILANDPRYEVYWHAHAAFLDRVTSEVERGEFKPASMQQLLPAPFVPDAIRRLQTLRAGPFSK